MSFAVQAFQSRMRRKEPIYRVCHGYPNSPSPYQIELDYFNVNEAPFGQQEINIDLIRNR